MKKLLTVLLTALMVVTLGVVNVAAEEKNSPNAYYFAGESTQHLEGLGNIDLTKRTIPEGKALVKWEVWDVDDYMNEVSKIGEEAADATSINLLQDKYKQSTFSSFFRVVEIKAILKDAPKPELEKVLITVDGKLTEVTTGFNSIDLASQKAPDGKKITGWTVYDGNHEVLDTLVGATKTCDVTKYPVVDSEWGKVIVIEATLEKAKTLVEAPEFKSLEYTGKALTPVLKDGFDKDLYIIHESKTPAINVGKYVVEVELADKENCVWAYHGEEAPFGPEVICDVDWYITPMLVELPEFKSLEYTGKALTPVLKDGFDKDLFIIHKSETPAINVGEYQVDVELADKKNCVWAYQGEETPFGPEVLYSPKWNITPMLVELPEFKSLEYTGKALKPVLKDGYNKDLYIIMDSKEPAIKVGKYVVDVALADKENCVWAYNGKVVPGLRPGAIYSPEWEIVSAPSPKKPTKPYVAPKTGIE